MKDKILLTFNLLEEDKIIYPDKNPRVNKCR